MVYFLLWVGFFTLLALTIRSIRRAQRRTPIRRLFPVLWIMLFTLMTLFLLTETTFLYFLDFTDAGVHTRIGQRWLRRHFEWNQNEFRDREHTREPKAGTYRIAVLGDSFVFGIGLDEPADRFPDLLEASLTAARNAPVEIINMGIPGWNTRDELNYFSTKGVAYQPDMVVLTYSINDIQGIDDSEPKPPVKQEGLLPFLSRHYYSIDFLHFYFGSHLRQAIQSSFEWILYAYDSPELLSRHGADIAAIKKSAMRITLSFAWCCCRSQWRLTNPKRFTKRFSPCSSNMISPALISGSRPAI